MALLEEWWNVYQWVRSKQGKRGRVVWCVGGLLHSYKKKGWRGRRRRTGYRRSLVSSGYSPHQNKSNMGQYWVKQCDCTLWHMYSCFHFVFIVCHQDVFMVLLFFCFVLFSMFSAHQSSICNNFWTSDLHNLHLFCNVCTGHCCFKIELPQKQSYISTEEGKYDSFRK